MISQAPQGRSPGLDPGDTGAYLRERVIGNSRDGAGIKGTSSGGRGGQFESARAAQVQLIPHPPAFELPGDGQNGDLIALSEVRPIDLDDPGLVTELWFCTKGSSPGKPATWGRVHFDKFK